MSALSDAHSGAWARSPDATAWIAAAALAVGALGAVVFASAPKLDLSIANWFYVPGDPEARFIGHQFAVIDWLRNGFVALFVASCTLIVAGLIFTRLKPDGVWLQLNFTKWLFLAVCLAMGPGVVANLALKDHWGRARPSQISDFGGSQSFAPALKQSDQCDRNCSFVCGEASSMFMLFFAGAYVYRRRANTLVATGVGAGLLAGLVRMAQGAHFLSDVIFAGVFMALTAALIHFVFEAIATSAKRERGLAPAAPTPMQIV